MSVSRLKTWVSGETLTASDQNAEFDNLINNQQSLGTPRTAAWDMDGFELILDADADTSITVDSDDRIDIKIGGTDSILLGLDATNTSGVYTFDGRAVTATAATNVARLHVKASNALTIPSGTTAIVAGLWIAEPNLTATGTITKAATAYIAAAPTEGGTNYALWVDAGNVQLDGNLTVDGTATLTSPVINGTVTTTGLTLPGHSVNGDLTLPGSGASALLLNVGSTALSTGTAAVQVGNGRTGSGASLIDLVGDTTYTDWGGRLLRESGANGGTLLLHRGTGNLSLRTDDAAPITFSTSGALRLALSTAGGLYSANATGGDMGIDTINAKAVYDDGVGPLTDYVLDYAVDGGIDFSFYDKTLFGSAKARAWDPDNLDLDQYAASWKQRRALPPFLTKAETFIEGVETRQSIGEKVQALVETAETQAVLIEKLNQRTLEAKR